MPVSSYLKFREYFFYVTLNNLTLTPESCP